MAKIPIEADGNNLELGSHFDLPVIIQALRPRQWIKNLLVFAGPLFTAEIFKSGPLLRSCAAFVLFCALSSAIYLVNDVVDRNRDREHPLKRYRPIASGALNVFVALIVALIFAVVALAVGTVLGLEYSTFAIGFVGLNLLYSLWLKHEVLLDVLCIAAGFLIRAGAGAAAIHVSISPWLLVCASMLALVIGFGKRRQEVISLGHGSAHRKVLSEYGTPFLDQLISILTSATLVTYLFYSFQSETAHLHHWIPVTIPFALYGLFRYLYLVYQRKMGSSPEDLLFCDGRLLAAAVGWFVAAAIAMGLH